jgi:hypothetical protein
MSITDFIIWVIGILLFLCLIAFFLFSVRIEQQTFNKYSTTKATYIEAMFTNLRVIPD